MRAPQAVLSEPSVNNTDTIHLCAT